MSFQAPATTDQLLKEAASIQLYGKLLEQVNKDFNFANESVDFHPNTTPEELKIQLNEKVFRLIQYHYAELLNLLYIIDVPEENVKQLDGTDTVELAKQLSYLILRREWMKVWFRAHY
jgi:hypothetical protein